MYVSSSAPIPMGDATCKTRASNRRIAQDQCRVARGSMALFNTTPSAGSLSAISPELAANGATMLAQSELARASVLSGGTSPSLPPASVVLSAPQVVPLNGQAPADLAGCKLQTVAPAKPPVVPLPVMPKPGPVSTPAGLRKLPAATNLCWALRNGAVDASQFDRQELAQLMYRCSQLGYTGACPPPTWVIDYLNANRGSLPKIQVTQAMLDSLPQAPDMSGVNCPQSYKMGGLAGVAPPWGDAEIPEGAAAAVTGGGFRDWVKGHPLLSLGIAGGLLYLATDEKRGRRGY